MTDLIARFNLKESNLERFKCLYGISMFSLHKKLRLARAQWMLQTTNHSIKYIALTVGYLSQISFSEAYKIYYGYCPRKEREK